MFLRLLRRMEGSGQCQVLMATHSPLLMAYPGAELLQLSHAGLTPTKLEQTGHFALTREFCADPTAFVEAALAEDGA
jgi:predicted ATPase